MGYDEGGQLTEAVRRKPYSVVLFDEMEKAHADVFNILLQMLDDGRLTDGHGRTVDFRNTVLIMTSNVGSHLAAEMYDKGANSEEMEGALREVLKNTFRPEFLNRIDEILVFRSLERKHMEGIVRIQLERMKKLLKERDLYIDVDDDAVELLARRGYDPAFGARPLKRAIQKHLMDPLAQRLIRGDFGAGQRLRATLDSSGEAIEFSAESA